MSDLMDLRVESKGMYGSGMRLGEDFEPMIYLPTVPPKDDAERLARALTLLEKIQWGSTYQYDRGPCPMCGREQDDEKGHHIDCELAALIRKESAT